MSSQTVSVYREAVGTDVRALWFGAATLGVAAMACALAGWAPLGFSIVTVFLFAGPHNWLEARYMLSRMPARWGALRSYFLTGIGGAFGLTALYAAVAWGPLWTDTAYILTIATWNTLLIAWITVLGVLRSRQNPRRNWEWLIPAAFVAAALNWLWPVGWSLVLVYAHPLMALWFLDRELRKTRPKWRATYHFCLACLPLFLLLLWWNLYDRPNLYGDDVLSVQITRHAGGGILAGVSTHLLVATHTFLEMLHYGVWIVAIPLVSVRSVPWRVDNVPLARRSSTWRRAIQGLVLAGIGIVILLWVGFLADYPLVRSAYFTVAMLHVLAEVPFLLRLL